MFIRIKKDLVPASLIGLHPFLTQYTIFYKSFWGYWYLAWAVSSLLLWASTRNFS